MSHPILDPLSFLAPGLIEPNLSLRELSDRGRDKQFNDDDLRCWKTSLASLEYFEFLKIPKWFKTSTFGSKQVNLFTSCTTLLMPPRWRMRCPIFALRISVRTFLALLWKEKVILLLRSNDHTWIGSVGCGLCFAVWRDPMYSVMFTVLIADQIENLDNFFIQSYWVGQVYETIWQMK